MKLDSGKPSTKHRNKQDQLVNVISHIVDIVGVLDVCCVSRVPIDSVLYARFPKTANNGRVSDKPEVTASSPVSRQPSLCSIQPAGVWNCLDDLIVS
jgi:hypothetical protein